MTRKVNNKIARRRNNLFALDPHCFYCNVEVVNKRARKGQNNDNLATIDHLDSHWVSLKKLSAHDGGRKVLCCRKCNQERNKKEIRRFASKKRFWWQRLYKRFKVWYFRKTGKKFSHACYIYSLSKVI